MGRRHDYMRDGYGVSGSEHLFGTDRGRDGSEIRLSETSPPPVRQCGVDHLNLQLHDIFRDLFYGTSILLLV